MSDPRPGVDQATSTADALSGIPSWDWLLAEVDRLRADLAEARRVIARTVQMHQVVGAYCPLCPGDDAAEQPNCPHRARACGTCKSSRWPCPTFAALTAEGTDRTGGDER